MQTTGACLLAVNRCSPAGVRMPAQDSRSVHGLLYFAALRADRHKQEHRPASRVTRNGGWLLTDQRAMMMPGAAAPTRPAGGMA